MKPRTASISVIVLLALQVWLVRGFVGAEYLPPPPDLAQLPSFIDGWRRFADVAIPAATAEQLRADRVLDRIYIHQAGGETVDLLVAWFQSQRGGATQPHSPRVCLPGSGWLPIEDRILTLNTDMGELPVHRYVVTNRGRRAVALYWYQTPRRTMTGEWEAKFFTLADGLRDRRTDTAIVRLFLLARPDNREMPAATHFARAVYPWLRRILPR